MPGNSLPEFAQLSFPPSLPPFKFLETIKNEGFFFVEIKEFLKPERFDKIKLTASATRAFHGSCAGNASWSHLD